MARRAPELDLSLDSVINLESLDNGITFSRNHLRGYPETFSLHRRKLMQHPYGKETQGDHQAQVGLASDVYD
jgi:hypothetical protein